MGIKLFEHNKVAYDAAMKMLKETGKAAIVHPTGTGKSFIGFKICEDYPAAKICWLSPSEYIFKTQLENLKRTSDGFEPQNITFLTYARLMNMSEEELAEINPDYIVLDEFHRCGAEQWGKGVANILTMYKSSPVLGLSATNIRYLDNQRDMADELFDGNVASQMTLGEAIVRGILDPPTYVVSIFSYQKDFEKLEFRVKHAKNKAVKDEAQKYLEALRRALDKAEGLDVIFEKHIKEKSGKYIVFTANAEHMHETIGHVSEWFSGVDIEPHIYSVYSDDPDASADFANFKADDSDHLKLLFCIDMLNEGIHVDDISGVILFRPTVSPIVYKQQIGRALSAGKKSGEVPLILDIVANINSLSSVDSITGEMAETLQYFHERGESEKIVNENFTVYDEVCDCLELFNKLEGVLSSSWDEMFERLIEFKNEFSHVDVANTYKTPDNLGLGGWCAFQRKIRKGLSTGILTSERIEKLDSLGFSWNPIDDQWENGFAHAQEFAETNGYLDVPINHICKDNFKLGAWIVHQKAALKNGTIGQERYEKLCELGLEWDHDKFIWQRNYELCRKYLAEHKNLDIPTDYLTNDGIALGIWLKSIKSRKNTINSRYKPLSDDQIEQLELIGFSFENTHHSKWNTAYEVAKSYFDENQTINISSTYVTKDGFKLGAWLHRQRLQNAGVEHGVMPKEHKSLLDALNFDWSLREKVDTWTEYFDSCKRFMKENPKRQIPVKYVDETGKKLGSWVANQKHAAKLGKLSAERVELLHSIGITLEDVKATWWKTGYKHALSYYESHGDLSVPTLYKDEEDYPVGEWIRTQVKLNKSGKLAAERKSLLDKIGVDWKTGKSGNPLKKSVAEVKHAPENYNIFDAI